MTPHDTPPLIICPRCGAPSWNPIDAEQGYCGRCHDWTQPTGDEIERLYIPEWTNALMYGSAESQDLSMYALRSHGWETHGVGYGDEFYWETRHPRSEFWCRIFPAVKP